MSSSPPSAKKASSRTFDVLETSVANRNWLARFTCTYVKEVDSYYVNTI